MARPISPRVDLAITRNRTAQDPAQVPPDSGATIELYRRGATVSQTVILEESEASQPVPVFDPGEFAVGDLAKTGSEGLPVSGLDATTLWLQNNTGGELELVAGTRLLPFPAGRPLAYSDPLAIASIGSSPPVEAGTGRVSFYLARNRVDYEVAIPGLAPRVHADVVGTLGRSDRGWSDLRDFGGRLDVAIRALPPVGGRVYVPLGDWPQDAGVMVDIPGVTIFGSGYGSVLRAATPNAYDLVTVRAPSFRMQDLTVDGGAGGYSANGASSVVVLGLGLTQVLVLNEYFENVRFTGAARHGLWFKDAINMYVKGCHFDGNFGSGAKLETPVVGTGVTTVQFMGCSFRSNGGAGCELVNASTTTFNACTFEGNQGLPGTGAGNALHATSCIQLRIHHSRFGPAGSVGRPDSLVSVDSSAAAIVDGCRFDGGPDPARRPKWGVAFQTSPLSRLTSCTGRNLSTEGFDGLAYFDGNSQDCVELANLVRAVDGTWGRPRLYVVGPRFLGASRGAIGVPVLEIADDGPSGANVSSGALTSAEVPLQTLVVWDGLNWRSITLEP